MDECDVMLVIGANPTDAHPVFASRMKKRLREGARLIVLDPRGIDMVRSPHVLADFHLPLRPGTNVAVVNALSHVIVTEGLEAKAYIAERCDPKEFARWTDFIRQEVNSPEAMESITGVAAADVRGAARLYATGGNGAIYYGLGVTEPAGFYHGDGHGHLAMLPKRGAQRCGREPLARPRTCAGFLRHGLVPPWYSGYRT